jgi:hypothetical protein
MDYAFDVLGFEKLFSPTRQAMKNPVGWKRKPVRVFCKHNRENSLILPIRSAKFGN